MRNHQEDRRGEARATEVVELAAEAVAGTLIAVHAVESHRGEAAEVQGCEKPQEETSESHQQGDIQRIRGKEAAA